jgi:hypothetical protein
MKPKNWRRMVPGSVGRIAILRVFAAFTLLIFTGCGPDRFIVLTNPPGATTTTGNWQITASTSSGTQPFSALTGSIVETASTTSGQSSLFAILQALQPGSCFDGLTTLPLEGNLTGQSFSLLSFSDSGQYLNLSGKIATDDNTLTGTFLIDDGCANGTKGSLSGTKISPLTGTYAGPSTLGSAGTLSLTVSQDSFSDGIGYFHLSGTSTFAGVSCFTSGNLDSSQSTISGEQVLLTVTTNEPSTVVMSGTLNPAATQLTLGSIQVVSGGCSGDAGTANLTS